MVTDWDRVVLMVYFQIWFSYQGLGRDIPFILERIFALAPISTFFAGLLTSSSSGLILGRGQRIH